MKRTKQGRVKVYKSCFLELEVKVDAEDMSVFETEPLCLMWFTFSSLYVQSALWQAYGENHNSKPYDRLLGIFLF